MVIFFTRIKCCKIYYGKWLLLWRGKFLTFKIVENPYKNLLLNKSDANYVFSIYKNIFCGFFLLLFIYLLNIVKYRELKEYCTDRTENVLRAQNDFTFVLLIVFQDIY